MKSSRELLKELDAAIAREEAELAAAKPPVLPTPPVGVQVVWGVTLFQWGELVSPYEFFSTPEKAVQEAEWRVRQMCSSEHVIWRGDSCHAPGERDYAEIKYWVVK